MEPKQCPLGTVLKTGALFTKTSSVMAKGPPTKGALLSKTLPQGHHFPQKRALFLLRKKVKNGAVL